jgi:hypothetical protein
VILPYPSNLSPNNLSLSLPYRVQFESKQICMMVIIVSNNNKNSVPPRRIFQFDCCLVIAGSSIGSDSISHYHMVVLLSGFENEVLAK